MASFESSLERTCTFVVPGDPDQNTGGYRYVRRVCEALREQGWKVSRQGLSGHFPMADNEAREQMEQCLAAHQDGSLVVLDGLAMGALPEIVTRHAGRLTLIALVHHPLADETGLDPEEQERLYQLEREALRPVAKVISTSRFTARRLRDFAVDDSRVAVVEPGVDRSSQSLPPLSASPEPNLLCVANLSPRKAQMDLLKALEPLQHLPWHLTLAGSTEREPDYASRIVRQCDSLGMADRVSITGEVAGDDLQALYREADLFVLPSLYEGYGMVIDEARAAGLPIICSDGGALAETADRDGIVQYSAGDVAALTSRLERWLSDPEALHSAARHAREQAEDIRSWSRAAHDMASIFSQLPAQHPDSLFQADWLALREPADRLARNGELVRSLNTWAINRYMSSDYRRWQKPLQVVDLGSGTGANARFLVPWLTVPQEWSLVDQDPKLLEVARQKVCDLDVAADFVRAELNASNLAKQIPEGTDLVTASALIDLVSEDWLESLAERTRELNAALLITLSYNGKATLSPAATDDEKVLSAFNQHQRRDKGSGGALGPDAASTLARKMGERDYRVSAGAANWELDQQNQALQKQLLTGWRDAATEQCPADAKAFRQWFDLRSGQARQGALSITVGHTDLLALPPEPADDARP